MCPFVQAQFAKVRTPIRIWPSEPWCGEHVLEGGRGLEGVRDRVCTREGVRERVCARDCMYAYASCRSNGEVVREGVCKSVCVHWYG